MHDHNIRHSYASFAIDVIFIAIALRYSWAAFRIYRKIRATGMAQGIVLKAVLTFVGKYCVLPVC